MENIKAYPIVYCVWEDIVSTDTAWKSLDEAIDWVDSESGLVSQVGFMLEKNDEYLILMDSFFNNEDTIGAITRIPIECVRYIKKMSIDDYKKKGG